jgi:2-polyprenyl-6-hydroxyphenyl methylase/3-demethylubiquinone-9 3-methyltransferase
LGSATNLPWANGFMDVCIAPELIEHVVEWKACLTEFARILKSNGVLFISTANKLCPKQQEFNLPFYSWYPALVKRYFENLARTTRQILQVMLNILLLIGLVIYQLRKEFLEMGMESFDQFDIMDMITNLIIRKLS